MLKRASIYAAATVFMVFLATQTGFAQTSGADNFKAKCEMCHGADGLANTSIGKSLGVPSYKSPEVRKLSDAQLAAVIKNGKNNKMPAFAGQLTDAQIKDVVLYVRKLQKK